MLFFEAIAALGVIVLMLFGLLPMVAFLAGVFLAPRSRPLKRFPFLLMHLVIYCVAVFGFLSFVTLSILTLGFGLPLVYLFVCLIIFWSARTLTRRAVDAGASRLLVVVYGLMLSWSIPLSLSIIGLGLGIALLSLSFLIWLYLLVKPSV
ncbi:MAG: hypothetical protein QM523_02020 [Candidatus Pacebacteria bacterium]|nr:hypothetical protein [Candidatus Paceibacterota bacterium]